MFNKKNNKVHKLSTVQAKLSEVQTTLLAFDFELLEIWSPDDGNDKEVWFNKKKNKTMQRDSNGRAGPVYPRHEFFCLYFRLTS